MTVKEFQITGYWTAFHQLDQTNKKNVKAEFALLIFWIIVDRDIDTQCDLSHVNHFW